jgi:Flp pilus assembly pilin Flp
MSLNHFRTDESGVTAIEYALIASGIAMAIVTVKFDRCRLL